MKKLLDTYEDLKLRITDKKRIEVIDRALEFISGPEGAKRWCKDHMALDAKGFRVSIKSKKAVRWCAAGALCKVSKYGNVVWKEITDKLRAETQTQLTTLNDTKGRGAVIKVLKKYKKELLAKKEE